MPWSRRKGRPCLPALLLLLVASSCERPPAGRAADFSRTPVLLVHGLGEQSSIWHAMRRHLEHQGIPAQFIEAVDLGPPGGANIGAAEDHIRPAVERLLARGAGLARRNGFAPPTRVDIVSHSMGALSSRVYSARLHPERVRTLITLAGANHGSDRFCPPRGSPGERELCPAFAVEPPSGVQVLLNGTPAGPVDETPWGVGSDPAGRPRIEADSARRIRYATVDPVHDAWILPDSSLRIAGTGGFTPARPLPEHVSEVATGRFVVEGTDHDAIVSNQAAMTMVALLLAAGEVGTTVNPATPGASR